MHGDEFLDRVRGRDRRPTRRGSRSSACGGSGGNAVNTMINFGLEGVEFIVVNTDAQALNANAAPTKLPIGVEHHPRPRRRRRPREGPQGGARGRAAHQGAHRRAPTWSSSPPAWAAAPGPARRPIIAQIAREEGALTVGVVTKPFLFEGRQRARRAELGLAMLGEHVDTLITIPNQKLALARRRRPHVHRRVPQGRRGALPGRQGHQRSHHAERHRQRRLRRREDRHEPHGPRAHGHGRRQGPEPRAARRRDGRHLAAARRHQRRGRDRACSSTSSAARTSR